MRPRILSLVLITLATTAWLALRAEPTVAPAPSEAPFDGDAHDRLATTRHDDAPDSTRLEPVAELPKPQPTDPLVRHRDRLRDTASRLAARRAAAVASGAPEPTVQALAAHLARVEQRLATLDVASAAGVAVGGASPAAPSTVARP